MWIDPIVQPEVDSKLNIGAVHFHAGTRTTSDGFMTHISITRGPATWGDHVTDAEYGGATH